MPPKTKPTARTRAVAPEPDVEVEQEALEQPSRSDVLAAEAVPPPGWELLVPFHALNRRGKAEVRAAVARALKRATGLNPDAVEDVPDEGTDPTLAIEWWVEASDYELVVADIQDALTLAAAVPARFVPWAEDATPDALTTLFNRYVASMGEAPASPS